MNKNTIIQKNGKVGSNPTAPTKCGIDVVVAWDPSKFFARVRISYPAPVTHSPHADGSSLQNLMVQNWWVFMRVASFNGEALGS